MLCEFLIRHNSCLFCSTFYRHLAVRPVTQSRLLATKAERLRTKFARAIDGIPAFVQGGIDGDQITELIRAVEKNVRGKTTCILSDSLDDKNLVMSSRSLIPIVKSALDNYEKPVILKLDWAGGGAHWVVAIGYEAEDDDVVSHLLVLDPGFDISRTKIWNGLLSVPPKKPAPSRILTGVVTQVNMSVTAR